jgi:hypothetical protein
MRPGKPFYQDDKAINTFFISISYSETCHVFLIHKLTFLRFDGTLCQNNRPSILVKELISLKLYAISSNVLWIKVYDS